MTRIHKTAVLLLVLIALAIGLTLHQVLDRRSAADPAQLLEAGIILLPQPRQLPALSLTDQDGRPLAVDQLKGRWSLLFFGYTFCPDICPTSLAQMRDVIRQLPLEARERLRVVLVSVDPHRDTPRQLKQYLGYFDPAFIGLTGDLRSIQALANGVGIPFVPADTSKPGYTVDHSGNLVIIGPDGRQRGFIRAPLDSHQLAAQLPALLGSEG
jgi:protein SCO1/2